MNSDAVITDGDWFVVNSTFFFSILQFQYTPGTNSCTNTASHTGCPRNVLTPLCIPPDINSHFAMSRAVTAGYALSAIGCNPEL